MRTTSPLLVPYMTYMYYINICTIFFSHNLVLFYRTCVFFVKYVMIFTKQGVETWYAPCVARTCSVYIFNNIFWNAQLIFKIVSLFTDQMCLTLKKVMIVTKQDLCCISCENCF